MWARRAIAKCPPKLRTPDAGATGWSRVEDQKRFERGPLVPRLLHTLLLAVLALAWSIILLSMTTRTGPLLFGDSSEAGYDSCCKPSVCILSSTGHTETRGTLRDMAMYCASLKTIRACDMLARFSWGSHSTSQVVQLQSPYVVSCP